MDDMTVDPLLSFWIFKENLKMIAYATFNVFSNFGVFFKWTLSFRCYCHLVEYPPMSSMKPQLPKLNSVERLISLRNYAQPRVTVLSQLAEDVFRLN